MIEAIFVIVKDVLFSKWFLYLVAIAAVVWGASNAISAYDARIETKARAAEREIWAPKFDALKSQADKVVADVKAIEVQRAAEKSTKERNLQNASKSFDIDSQASAKRRIAAAAGLADSGTRLRSAVAAATGGDRDSQDPAAATQCAADRAAARMLARVHSISDRLAGIYSEVADESRDRGLACERHYDQAVAELGR